ncbi:MAG: hypothetical protein ACM359_17185, partial [Bacillota bacterium]
GIAAFDMQPGTYTLRIAKLGYSGHSATVTINAEPATQGYDAQVNVLAAISAPPDPDKCTAYLTTYDAVGIRESGVSIELRLVSPPPGNAQAFSAKPWTILSDGDGVVQAALLKNAAYQARRGSGEWHLVKTTNVDTIPLPTVLSHPNK